MNALQLLSECITLGIERGSLYKIADLVSELFIAFCNCFPAVVIVDACAYSDYNDEDGGKNLPPRMLVCLQSLIRFRRAYRAATTGST